MKRIILHGLGPVIAVILFAAALWVLHQTLGEYRYRDIMNALHGLSRWQILLALVFTGLSYLVLIGYDVLAVRYVGHVLPWRKMGFAAATSYAFSNTIGFSVLTSGSVRYRLYSGWGLNPVEIAKIVVFNAFTLWLGILTTGGIILLAAPLSLPDTLGLSFAGGRLMGLGMLTLPVAYVLFSILRQRSWQIRAWVFDVVPIRLALLQLLVGCLDWSLAGMVLYVLLPASDSVGLLHFLGLFLIAQTAGLISHVPGGLGVFESLILLMFPADASRAAVLGALLVYRLIYYLLPLAMATIGLGIYEGLRHRQRLKWVPKLVGSWIPALLPHIFALMTLVCGAVLLFSAATPAVTNRMEWLADIIPLPVLEASHFISSLVGMALVLLARGLQRRLDAAWLLTTALLVVGITVSLLKGADYEEAVFLAVLLLGLLPCRRRFYRKSSLIDQRFTAGWLATITVVFICTAWLCLFAYQHVEYSHDLWWQFSFTEGDAPRSLRALVGTVGLALLIAGAKLLQPAPTALAAPATAELEQARPIVAACQETYPHLALLGDKSLLFNASKTGFVMYGVEGRSWVSMGDPVGPAGEKRELAWAFRELCEYYDGWTVFYEVRPEYLDLYLELGLDLLKIGEEARVPLAGFSLEGKSRRSLRGAVKKLEREGYDFIIVPPQAVDALLPQLRQVSDAWLSGKNAREKGFSLGFFKEEYLKTCPLALVRQDERIIAFANLLISSEKEELSIDLMRFVPDAPNGIMDYLFIRLMLWGKEQRYAWFNLGMAPLAGLESRTLAPLWNRFGALVFGHGERFYNFQGLRQYKDKFAPRWEPRYLAVPSGFALPRILVNISALIARGLKGIIKK